MKSFILSVITICLISSLGFSQNACSKYYPFKDGAKFTYTNYDKKGKLSGKINYTVTNVRNEGGNEVMTLAANIIDKKDNQSMDFEYDVTCTGNGISIDFNSLGNMGMLQQFENMETEITGTNMIIPNELSVSQKLPDASMNMKISMGISMEVNVKIIDREIIAKERITTPAGTFNCYVLQATTVMDMMGRNMTSTSKSWFAEGVGMVKQVTKGEGGKMDSSSELTMLDL